MSTTMVVLVGSDRRAFGKMKATLDDIVVIVTTLFFMEGTFVVTMIESRAVFALVTMTFLDHHIGKFSSIRIGTRVRDRRSFSRSIHPCLFFGNVEVGHGQGMSRELKSRIFGVFFPEVIGEATSIILGHSVVPEISEVEVSDRYRFDAGESSVFANVTIEVNVIDDLANVDSTVEDVVFSSGFVMSSRDTMDERVFDAGELGHG